MFAIKGGVFDGVVVRGGSCSLHVVLLAAAAVMKSWMPCLVAAAVVKTAIAVRWVNALVTAAKASCMSHKRTEHQFPVFNTNKNCGNVKNCDQRGVFI